MEIHYTRKDVEDIEGRKPLTEEENRLADGAGELASSFLTPLKESRERADKHRRDVVLTATTEAILRLLRAVVSADDAVKVLGIATAILALIIAKPGSDEKVIEIAGMYAKDYVKQHIKDKDAYAQFGAYP